MYESFDTVAPGWRGFLKAYRNNTFMVFNIKSVVPNAFMSYHHVLDEFKKYIK